MKELQLYCPSCSKITPHSYLLNVLATKCDTCSYETSQIERMQLEGNTYTAPDGQEGMLVENTPTKAVFAISKGKYAGVYVYDKTTGFGAIQNHQIVR